MTRAIIIAAFLVLAACGEAEQSTSMESAPCTDASRACVTEAAMSYIEALWAGDGANARLHPSVRRTHNGGDNAEDGAEAIQATFAGEGIAAHKNLRLVVYEAKGDVFALWIVEGPERSAHVAERIRVAEGLVTEIEVFVVLDDRPFTEIPEHWPTDSENLSNHGCGDPVRACLYDVANSYLDALVAADGSDVKFAPNVRRTQNGGRVQEGEDELRASVSRERLAFRRNFRLFADEEAGQVMALWVTGHDLPDAKFTAHVIERLRIEDGLISEIGVFYPRDMGTLEGVSGWPDEAP